MRPRRSLPWLAATLLVAHLACADAPHDIVELDSPRSHATFRVKVMWLIGIRGEFSAVQGNVDIDRFRSQAVVDARIDADSVRMNVRGYEDWVKSAEFFDASVHPEIRFVSDPFPLQRLRNGGELPGTLTLRGVSQPVRFMLEPATCAQPGHDCPIVATGMISRSPFGMRSRLGTLSDKVELDFSVFTTPSATLLAP
ncbi:YceI family protein [Dokdonella soli]|uniref:YceI family protein n=1 Tax=Dokdonella soli TaxID=529810 RepID=UPI0036D303B6